MLAKRAISYGHLLADATARQAPSGVIPITAVDEPLCFEGLQEVSDIFTRNLVREVKVLADALDDLQFCLGALYLLKIAEPVWFKRRRRPF